MKVKICGMREEQNIQEVLLANPDYLGFIFYPKSKRYVGDDFCEEYLDSIPNHIDKVAVFVNESLEKIIEICNKYSFDCIQLHGSESAPFIQNLKQKLDVKVIKAFGVDERFDFRPLEEYLSEVDYFLFDTKTKQHGGSGRTFDWELLNQYDGNKPFFLSGGLGNENIQEALKVKHHSLVGFDLNSGLESSPGKKDVQKVKTILETIRNNNNESNTTR